MKILRVKQLQVALRDKRKYIASGFSQGLKLGGLVIEAASIRQTPVEFGILRKSHRTESTGSGFKTKVEVSCQTDYALYVHENLNARHAPGTNAKFLERAARENAKRVVDLVKRSARNGI